MILKRKFCPLPLGCLVITLSHMPLAFSATNAIIWQEGDQIVRLARQDDDTAAANDHPKTATAGEISAMLASLRLRFADEEAEAAPMTVFTPAELDNLGSAIATGLDRAAPSQDIIFHVVGSRRLSPGAFTKRNRVTAGRVFYRDGKFNVIFGQVQTALRKKNIYGQTDQDFLPRNFGSREKATQHQVVLLSSDAVSLTRNDWVVIEPVVALAAATTTTEAQTTTAPPAQTAPPASNAAPVVVGGAAAIAATSSPPTSAASNSAKEVAGESGEMAPSIEERLETLKRLRDRELITEEAYQSRMAEILQDL